MFFTAGSAVRQALSASALTVVLAGSALFGVAIDEAAARGPALDPGASVVQVGELPRPAADTLSLIQQGGPFPYPKDGTVFGNRERLLPRASRGYYREYTVKTAGQRNRGARRIVCGGTEAKRPDACFYTDDHYASFRRIAP